MIVKHTLPNGVRVLAEPIPHVRSVAVGIWVGTGSENEEKEKNGISHFLEHMMFKGTKKRTARQIAEAFDEIGGQVNAFTSKEMTCYFAKVLDQHFSVALEVLADMFFESTFLDVEIEKEKKVIIEEIRMVEDTPDDLVHDLLSEVSMNQHTLGFPVIGTIENVQQITRNDLFDYKDKFYHPANTVVSIAGNLPADFLEQVESLFGHHFGTPVEVKKEIPVFSPYGKIKIKPTEQTHLCIGLPGLTIQDEQIYTMVLINNILGGNMSSRLFQEIREEHGLAYSVYSYHSAHRHSGLFAIYAGTAHGQEGEVYDRITHLLYEMGTKGVTEKELAKAKEQLKASLMLGLESTNNRMSRLGRNELLLGKHMSLDEIVETVEKITIEDANQLAQKIFSSPTSLALISPTGKIPPSFGGKVVV